MNGLLRRLTRRAATADETPSGTPAASEPVDATAVTPAPEGGTQPLPAAEDQVVARRARDLPAGLDPAELESRPGEGVQRGRLRRRVRYLRHVREVLLRDLGGFFYEVHRTAGGVQHSGHREILERKAARLAGVDQELRELEKRLGEPHAAETVVREPGVGGTCPNCDELHSSDADWCWHCGTPLSERARRRRDRDIDRAIADREARAAEQARAAAEEERARAAAATADGAAEETRDGAAEATGDGAPEATGDGAAEATGDGAAEETRDGAAEAAGDGAAEATDNGAAQTTPEGAGEEQRTAAGERSP